MEQWILFFCYIITVCEFVLNLIVFPITALNVYLIRKTSILHINLKWLLLCQCAAVVIYAFAKLDIVYKLATGNLFKDLNKIVTVLRLTGLTLSGMIGNFL